MEYCEDNLQREGEREREKERERERERESLSNGRVEQGLTNGLAILLDCSRFSNGKFSPTDPARPARSARQSAKRHTTVYVHPPEQRD